MSALHIVEPEELMHPEEMARHLASMFSEYCGCKLLPWMAKDFEQLIVDGFDMDMLEEVIIRTAHAPRPSWAYLSAIIRNARTAGAYDLPTFKELKTTTNNRMEYYYYY